MGYFNFLYFTKSEKIAISVLLFLIVVIGGVYLATNSPSNDNDIDAYLDNSAIEAFESSIQDKEQDASLRSVRGTNPAHQYKQFWPTYTPQPKFKAGEVIELNRADTAQLKMIPNIGSGYANRIVKYRDILGGFNKIEQLKEVWGMDDYLYEKIIPYMELKAKNRQLRINEASLEELNRHPYINYKQAKVIVDIRERKGKIESLDRLALLDEFTEQDLHRLRPYLSFQ